MLAKPSPVSSQPIGEGASPARLLTIPQTAKRHPGFSNRLRGFVMRADQGDPDYAGLRDAIVRIGRSVYIDEYRFLAWVDSSRGAAGRAA